MNGVSVVVVDVLAVDVCVLVEDDMLCVLVVVAPQPDATAANVPEPNTTAVEGLEYC